MPNPKFFNHILWILIFLVELARIFLQKFYSPHRVILTEEEITLVNNSSIGTLKFKDIDKIKYHDFGNALELKADIFKSMLIPLSSLSKESQALLFEKLSKSLEIRKIELPEILRLSPKEKI
ncbi:hypothetical protein SAMN04488541_100310 [Thermoflexibacter ruber]|uniref:Uncharacterized protein n=1 Tax=Thermoflexibacter ruber TaxID=1003 RepID=A0A1I2BGR5_9BACT|nr:hypothetical protein SAMN04488541_100310 [Thermoflexibacter ruber]